MRPHYLPMKIKLLRQLSLTAFLSQSYPVLYFQIYFDIVIPRVLLFAKINIHYFSFNYKSDIININTNDIISIIIDIFIDLNAECK